MYIRQNITNTLNHIQHQCYIRFISFVGIVSDDDCDGDSGGQIDVSRKNYPKIYQQHWTLAIIVSLLINFLVWFGSNED